MSNNKTSKRKNQKSKNMGHECGSGTRDYYRNKRLIEAGETYRSQKRKGPQKSPGSYRSRF